MRIPLLALPLLLLVAACDDPAAPAPADPPVEQAPPTEPDIVRVDHILIGVEGAPRLKADRVEPLEQARAKAKEIVAKLRAGADWDALKKEHSDDGPPDRPAGGPYFLANSNVTEPYRGVVGRDGMVKGFSDVAFQLDVGEVGLAAYHAKNSPFGFHVLKRLPLGPEHITVDHILIGVKGPGMPEGMTDEAARKKAYDLLAQLRAGGDWNALKRANSNDGKDPRTDMPGGPYAMANHGTQPTSDTEYPRGNMAPAFGDVGFDLEVGEIAIADYDLRSSPFGYHIIKRVK